MTPLKRVKVTLYRLFQQQHRCFYCSCDLTQKGKRGITIDHVVPACGSKHNDKPTNVVMACYTCNQEKGDRPPTDEEMRRLDNLNFAEGDLIKLGSAIDDYYQAVIRTPVYLNPELLQNMRIEEHKTIGTKSKKTT